MRDFQTFAVTLLAFQVTVSALKYSPENKDGFLLFLRQHFIPNFVSLEGMDCNQLMRSNFPTTGQCKEVNTYIVSFPDILQEVCGPKGMPYNNLRRSLDRFDLITCTLEEAPDNRLCNYHLHRFSATIAVGCDRYGYPVHLEEGDFQTVVESEPETSLTWDNYALSVFG